VLGIGGSTRRGSLSAAALAATLRLAEAAGARTTLATVRDLALPVANDDWTLADYPPSLAWLLAEVRAADALVLCTPTYYGTLSGAVKNVLDALIFLWDDDPPAFGGKPVALMAVGGHGAADAITGLHHATRALNGLSVPTVVTVPTAAIDPTTGDLRDDATRRRIDKMATELLDLGARLRRPIPWRTGATGLATVGRSSDPERAAVLTPHRT
jgi:FMN reductase